MTRVQYRHMMKLADMVENDGEPWDYNDICCCVFPRAKQQMGKLNSHIEHEQFYGIKSEKDYEYLFHIRVFPQNDNMGRKAVANRFRAYAKKHYKGVK